MRSFWCPLWYRILHEGQILHAIWHEKLALGAKGRLSGVHGKMSAGAITLCVMVRELPSTLRYVAQNQAGVVSRSQAIRAGLSPGMIKFRVRSGQWRPIHPGVYATFSGDLTRRTRLWAAVELVEDTRARFQLNVSEELACEALAYRLEDLLAS